MAEINVPVKLQIQNLQSLINELQNKLSNLKVGSSGFKAIQNTITAIRGEIDKLSIQTGKPFIDASQFSKAERSVEKLEEDIDKVGLVMSRLKFSDLELTSEQKADIKAFEDQLNSIKDKLRVVKNTAKDEFLKSAMGQEWLKIDETAFSKSLSQITNNIRKAVADQNTELNKLEQTALSYQKALSENERIKEFINKNKGDPLSEANLGDMYDKIFMTTAKGQFRYTNNGRNLLANWLEQQLHLDDSVIAQIINKNISAANVGGKLKEVLQNQMQSNQSLVDNNPNVTAKIEEAKIKYNELIAILKQVGLSEQEVTNAEQILRAAFTTTTGNLNAYTDRLVEIARGNTDVQNTTGMMKSQLDSLRTTLEQTNGQFLRMQRTQQSFNQMKMAVVNFMGFNQVLNLTKQAIRNAINHIKELDSVMNKISIVTDMSTSDLWNQVDAYSKMAQAYGVSIKGAYEVSQIYYQQGLQTKDVLTLTNETLKLAKISGLDYATTTDYMTTALRGFKMEMTDAARVVDVYSNLAAHTAVSQEELAVAMSKTASSMESVGATFEEASAMIGTMVAVTRESATNIGSAMKSIASRYGELTKDPTKLVDEEGEAMAFNKVDAALQSVGISMKTVDGQFREFTDVIVELGEKWDQLDSTQQRYIATQFAGNRQQSRFLALVSNVDLLKSNLDVAMNSEDTGTLQALKALDSVESKIEQVRVAYQQFYTTIGVETVWKGFLDGTKTVINTLNSMPKLFGKIPIAALNAVGSIIALVKSLGVHLLSGIANTFGQGLARGIQSQIPVTKAATENLVNTITQTIQGKTTQVEAAGQQLGTALNNGLGQAVFKRSSMDGIVDKDQVTNWYNRAQTTSSLNANEQALVWNNLATEMQKSGVLTDAGFNIIKTGGSEAIAIIERLKASIMGEGVAATESASKLSTWSAAHQKGLSNLMAFGSALNLVATAIDTTSQEGKRLSGIIMAVGGTITTVTAIIKAAGTHFQTIPWVAIASGIIAAISGISQALKANSLEAQLEEATAKAEKLSNTAKELKANYRTLDTGIKKYKELAQTRYDSTEAAEEYQNAVDELAESFPSLVQSFDDAGNAILDASQMEGKLTEARQKAAEAAYNAAIAESKKSALEVEEKEKKVRESGNRIGMLVYSDSDIQSTGILGTYKGQNDHEEQIKWTAQTQTLYSILLQLQKDQKLTDTQLKLLTYMQDNQITTDGKILSQLMTQLSLATWKGNLPEAANYKNLLEMAYTSGGWTKPKDIEKELDNFTTALGEIQPILDMIEISNKTAVDSWLRGSKYYDLPFIQNSSALYSVVENELYNTAKSTNDFSKSNLELQGNALLTSANQLWNILSPNTQEEVNKILKNSSNYTSKDLQSVLGEVAQLAPDWIYNIFRNQTENIKSNLQSKLDLMYDETSRDNVVYQQLMSMIQDENSEFTLKEQEFLVGEFDQIAQINQSGFDSFNLSNTTTALLKQIMQLSYNARNALLDQILTNGFSAEGWQKTLDYIKNNTQFNFRAIDTNKIDTIIHETIPNYSLAASVAIDNIENSWKDIDKFYSSLQKGVNKTELNDLINQAKSFGIILDAETDFVADGENMVLIAGQLEQVINSQKASLKNEFNTLINDLQDTYDLIQDSEVEMFANDDNQLSKDFVNTNLKRYQRILGTDFTDYFRYDQDTDTWSVILDEGESLAEAEVRIQAIVSTHYDNALEELQSVNQYYDLLFNNLSKSIKWKTGDYSSLIETGLYKNQEEVNARLLELASGIELSEDELKQPDVRSARDQVREAYNKLISDIFDKGINNIKLSDYEGIIGISQADITGTYENFILKYAKHANYSVKQMNEAWLNAIEKDNAKFSNDAIKDLQFISRNQFQASSSELKDLAERFNIDLTNEQVRQYIKYNKDLGEFIVEWTKISELEKGLPEVSGYEDTVKDSINSFFDNLVSLIKNALNGSLTNAEASKLSLEAEQYLGITDLDFTETAEGLKLSERSAIELYDALKKTDNLKSRLIFDELNKSLKETNVHYKDISSIQARIKKLNEDIAGLPVDDKRRQKYEEELELAKEILAVRSTSEDSGFEFMSNKIPGAQNNPLNYFSNWASAWKTLEESSKTGTIDYTAFYNIVTEMGNLAEKSGQIAIGADKVLHNSQEASDLIEAAAQCLQVDKTGALTINLGKLAELGFNFESAGADMSESVTKGIKDFAAAQVEMLDGMINLLETIAAMEQLGDIDVDKNGIINLTDIVENGIFTDGFEKAIANFDANSEKYQAYFESVIIDGKNVWQILHQKANEFTEEQVAAINALWQAYQSGEYDLNNVLASLQAILGESYNIKLESTQVKLERKIEVTDEPKVTVNGEEVGNIIEGAKNIGNTIANWATDTFNKLFKNGEKKTTIVESEATQVNVKTNENTKVVLESGNTLSLSDTIKLTGTAGQIIVNSDDSTSIEPTTNLTNKFIEEISTVLKDASIPVDKINLSIKAFNLANNVIENNALLNTSQKTELETILSQSLTDAALNGDVTLAKLIIRGFSDPIPELPSNLIVDGNLNLDSLKNMAARATLKSLQVVVENLNTDDVKTIANETGLTLEISGATAHVTGISEVKLDKITADVLEEQFELVIKDAEGNITTLDIPAQIGEINLGEYFDENGKYLGNLNADVLPTLITEALDGEWETWVTNHDTFTIRPALGSSGRENPIRNENGEANWIETLREYQSIPEGYRGGGFNYNEEELITLHPEISKEDAQALRNYELIISNIQDKLKDFEEDENLVDILGFGDNSGFEMLINGLTEYQKASNLSNFGDSFKGYINDLSAALGDNIDKLELAKVTAQQYLDSLTGESFAIDLDTINLENIESIISVLTEYKEMLVGADTTEADQAVETLNNDATSEVTKPVDANIDNATSAITKLDQLAGKPITKSIFIQELSASTGNIGLVKGNAQARGTLMGELGPELVVSNGHYFVAGQKGPEMVNLADDAIVFNHLQTKSLLEKGMSSGRGKAVTNERKAIAFAKGNIHGGPAKASVNDAIAVLKQLRAEWKALEGMSVSDLAGKGGGGGGGGGDPKAFIKDLEKWYNWLQRIAVLEQKINHEEQLRSKIQSDMVAHGQDYSKSLLETLPYLREQAAINKSLYESQQAEFERRREQMNGAQNPFSALYTFDEYGQLKYKPGALGTLSQIVGRDELTGEANFTAKEQYEKLLALNPAFAEYMKYDSSGNEIKQEGDDWYNTALQAFWDKVDADKEEMQNLHDSIEEHRDAVLADQEKINGILKEIEDNQIAVEEKVLKAVEESRQRQIDAIQDEKDAIEESSQALLDGLSTQLQKERDMLQNQENANELNRLQRQLAILQRSGGSASQIAALQKDITSKQQDAYFDAQQQQIDALQEASDNQLEKLQEQIDLMTEQLNYEKENGLLWEAVYQEMIKSPEEIAEFIKNNTKEYWGESPTKLEQDMREVLFQAQWWTDVRGSVQGIQQLITENNDEAIEKQAEEEQKKAEEEAQGSEDKIQDLSGVKPAEQKSEETKQKTYKHYAYAKVTYKDSNGKEQIANGWGWSDKSANDARTDAMKRAVAVGNSKGTVSGTPTIINSYDSGGIVDKDQYALVHAKESVLTPEQTSILRNEILSNKPTSLLSLLTDFRDAYNSIPGASSYSSIGASSGVIIEQATVEMNVAEIANDYDAQRAGEQALAKMLSIARKTQSNNRIGR